jgi:ABC-type multidrug transport system ATPase subunit
MVCDRVAILNQGRLVRVGTVNELTGAGTHYRVIVSRADDSLDATLSPLAQGYSRNDREITFTIGEEGELDRVIDCIRSKGVGLRELVQLKDTLEDAFVKIISEENLHDVAGNN